MAPNIEFFPFDDGPGANSEENRWGDMMKYMRTTGILTTSNTLSPTGDSAIAPQLNMQIQAYHGESWVEGFMFIHTGDTYPLVINDNTSGDPRIDLVTLRLDRDANTIEYHVEEGTPDPSPVAPTPVQDDVIWDLPLAEIAVSDGATVITTMDITDVRTRSYQAQKGSSNLVAGSGITITYVGDQIVISSP